MRYDGRPVGAGNRAQRRARRRAQLRAERRAARSRRSGAAVRWATTAALLTTALTCLGRTAAHAASFEVTNLSDAGAGSLRDAIAGANAVAGPDVITFAPGLTGTILLGSGQLTISDSLQIVGPGRDTLIIDGGAASRVFDIPLSPADVGVEISGLTVSNGAAQTGGGIRVQDETLTLDDVALIGNTALEGGGGLFADGFAMTLTVRDSTISGNAARRGGGVYIEDTLGVTVLDGVVLDGNTASEQGGGIFLYDPDADVVIDDSTISDNAARKGGGVYLYSQDGGSFTISNSTVSGNSATTGGGIYLYDVDQPVSISASTISGNTAANGGGINIDRISAPAVISNSTISGNTATGAGGGVRLARGGGLTIAHSTITENSAVNAGGARFPGPVTLSHVIVAGNDADTTADLHAAGGVTADFSIIGAMIGATTDGGGNRFGVTDPLLAPLDDNGGPTLTHLPLATSPAVDHGNPAVAAPAADQRGMPRVEGTIDIGAVEAQGSTIEFDAASVTVAEDAGTLAVSVTRTGTGDLPATVEIATDDGTAVSPDDYGAVSTQLSWAARETGTRTVVLPLVPDGADESDESFTVVLTGPTGATLGTSASLTVTIIDDDDDDGYTLAGFAHPVDMGSVINTVKSGSTVPLKFEVWDGVTELTDTAVVRSFTWATVSCSDVGTSATEDAIEQVTSGKTVLRYDSASGQFVQNWQTPKNRAGSCYRITMTTVDGSSLVAYFRLR